MPTYTYYCKDCDLTEEQIRKIADRDALRLCRRCRKPVERKIDYPASVWSPTSTTGGQRV